MKILITGGCGNVGVHVVKTLAQQGHALRVLDIDAEGLKKLEAPGVETIAGDIADKELVRKAVEGVDVILHLAWTFSGDLDVLLGTDIKGYKNLLDAAVEFGVEHVVNTTTAVAYGKPMSSPVEETQPHMVAQARNPIYALTKTFVEDMGNVYAELHGLTVNMIMIWYAYGNEIGGRHLRSMIREAIVDGVIEVPADSGGSFLQLDDFVDGFLKIIEKKPKGELFNFSTVYLTWAELCQIIVAQANPDAKVNAIPKDEWQGSGFLAEEWNFSIQKAKDMLGYESRLDREHAIAHLSKALESSVERVKAEIAVGK